MRRFFLLVQVSAMVLVSLLFVAIPSFAADNTPDLEFPSIIFAGVPVTPATPGDSTFSLSGSTIQVFDADGGQLSDAVAVTGDDEIGSAS